MLLALEDGTALRGDFVLRLVQRFDLTPIPSTIEATLRLDATAGDRIKVGAVLLAGTSRDRYRVVKLRRAPSQWMQGPSGQADAAEVTAILDGFAPLAWPAARAVVKDSATIGEILRSCGAAARISADVPAGRFACFVGQFPTVAIAQLLQEEAAALAWRVDGTLAIRRLADLFAGQPVEAVTADKAQAVESDFLERHEIPWALSTAAGGDVVLGRRDPARGWVYLPRTSPRVLDNMSRCLVVRKTVSSGFSPQIRAGDGFDVGGVRHVVTTAAHAWNGGGDGADNSQTTRLWLAQLQR